MIQYKHIALEKVEKDTRKIFEFSVLCQGEYSYGNKL